MKEKVKTERSTRKVVKRKKYLKKKENEEENKTLEPTYTIIEITVMSLTNKRKEKMTSHLEDNYFNYFSNN